MTSWSSSSTEDISFSRPLIFEKFMLLYVLFHSDDSLDFKDLSEAGLLELGVASSSSNYSLINNNPLSESRTDSTSMEMSFLSNT
jgi:hypothetical protein